MNKRNDTRREVLLADHSAGGVASSTHMHSLGAVLIQFDRARAAIRPKAARDAAAQAQLDTLLFRYEQPQEELVWGVDDAHGFRFDWCVIGGRWSGWGREVRSLMARQHIRPTARPIPRFLERNAIWSEDLGRVRLTASLFPLALLDALW